MIGIDVGGANLKIVDSKGVHIHYCPLWNEAPLTELLLPYSDEKAAVVMSGEQADGFLNKNEGIEYIVNSVKKTVPLARFYGLDGKFHDKAVPQLSAANWLVSADYLQMEYPDAVLVDMGSTTTDIIPLPLFDELINISDLRRLQKGYLVYTGLLRTAVPALLHSVQLDGVDTLISSELFAVSADAHRALGNISEEEYSIPTPDGAPKSENASLQRLARLVCADLDEIGEQCVKSIARQFWDKQYSCIKEQVKRVMEESDASRLITAGIGSRLLHKELGGIDLHEVLGVWSDALPSYAARRVALRNAGH